MGTEEKEEMKEYKTPAIVEDDDSSNDEAEVKKKRKKEKDREEKKEKKSKTPQGPVHIGSTEIVLKSELEPAIFALSKYRRLQFGLKNDFSGPNVDRTLWCLRLFLFLFLSVFLLFFSSFSLLPR